MKRYANQIPFIILMMLLYRNITNVSGSLSDWILQQLLMLPGIIIGLSFHEFAHAFVANMLGDNTAKVQGRLTVNPLAHIEPFGFATIFLAGFGWGKAVPVNPYNFKNRRRDEILVAVSGSMMNFFIALIFTFAYKIMITNVGLNYGMDSIGIILNMLESGIYINTMLMVFNLLPIPPLDGFSILTELFDFRRKSWYWNVYNNGFLILMVLVMTGITGKVMRPFLNILVKFFLGIILS